MTKELTVTQDLFNALAKGLPDDFTCVYFEESGVIKIKKPSCNFSARLITYSVNGKEVIKLTEDKTEYVYIELNNLYLTDQDLELISINKKFIDKRIQQLLKNYDK